MTDEYRGPLPETSEPLDPEDAESQPALDSEIDFDDEREEDQEVLDVVEAIEAGVLLDDPEEDPEPD
ncbi:MAG TPA: hypothetical protein VNF07_03255 [Acidimicrobiales bacterium]|nr:hypothetical protein [Acidimicrobiales bacterium]